MSGGPMIEMREMGKFFGAFQALKDVDLTVAKGEIVEAAAPEAFFAAPQTDRAKLFLSQILGH